MGWVMIIGDRLRILREYKKLSQGDIERRTGLLRCYVSRVENGHTVPSIDTLEKWSRAIDVPLHQIFHNGDEPSKPDEHIVEDGTAYGLSGKNRGAFDRLRNDVGKMHENDRQMLLAVAQRMAKKSGKSQ